MSTTANLASQGAGYDTERFNRCCKDTRSYSRVELLMCGIEHLNAGFGTRFAGMASFAATA
jgi:hypothetical protein